MPSTAGIVASGSAQLDQWLRANLVAFDERRSNPLVNLGTLGAAGDATATGTRRLVNTGDKAFVWLPPVASNFLSVDDAAALDITDNLEIVARVSMDDWTPSVLSCLASKNGTSSNYSWRILVNTNGTFRFDVSANGTVEGTAVSSAPGLVDGAPCWLKFRFAAGAVSFLKADDAETEPAHGSFSSFGTATMSGSITSIFSGTSPVRIGDDNANRYFGGNVHRFVMRTIGGADVLDIDPSVLTDEGATSFTATTGQPVTINRGTGTGYKTEIVVPGSGSRAFNGTSDFLEVADNDALDFSAAQSFSVWALVRMWGTPASSGRWVSKGQPAGVRWAIATNGATLQPIFALNDGTNSGNATLASLITAGLPTIVHAVVNRTAQTSQVGYDGSTVGPTTSITAVGSVANSENVTVGRAAGATPLYQHFRLHAWGIYPGALTAAQWAAFRDALLVPERAAA